MVGLQYFSRLLQSPGRELAAADLGGTFVLAARHELLDDKAMNAYR